MDLISNEITTSFISMNIVSQPITYQLKLLCQIGNLT